MNTIIRNEKGSAMLIALSLLAMLSLIAIAIVEFSDTDAELSYNESNGEKAFYIAEAGAKRAVMEIKNNMSWRTGYNNATFAGGSYSVRVIDSLNDSALVDSMVIRSMGMLNESKSEVEIIMTPLYTYPYAFGLFADAGIVLDRETCTDSYNSDSGTYATTVLDSLGDIGSNGTILTSKDVNFGGGIAVATPGGITLGINNTVNGDTTSAADSVKLDPIPASEFSSAEAHNRAPIGLSGSNYIYDIGTKSLTLGSSGNVVLSSGVYYFSSITAGQLSNISINPGDNVTIYVAGNIVMNQGSTFNQGGKPSDCMIYSSGANLQFDQGNIFNGTFYGPNAHIQYDQTTQAFGSLVGNTIKLDKGACFHYDRDLAKIRKRSATESEVVAWGEVN
jgi:hypothetical protein